MTETHDNSNLLHTYCRESVKAIHTGTNLAGSQSSILNFNSAITYTYAPFPLKHNARLTRTNKQSSKADLEYP